MRLLLIILSTLTLGNGEDNGYQIYQHKRNEMLQEEFNLTLGANLSLTEKEIVVNNCLMQYKTGELDYAFEHPKFFNMSRHYFSYRKDIRKTKVFKILRDMPKGAALHLHDRAMLGTDYLMKLTYMDHLYVCFGDDIAFRFANNVPNKTCTGKWQLVEKARQLSKNVTKFDENLRKHFTIVVDDPDTVYPTITKTWQAFEKYFNVVSGLVSYRPVFEQYIYDALKEFRADIVMYVEIRSSIPYLYELDGSVNGPEITAQIYKKFIEQFVNDYPDCVGARIIYARDRKANASTIHEDLEKAKQLKAVIPDYLVGFDLVGQEDKGRPLMDFAPELLAASNDLDYFFHAGETDWYGFESDENLVDAIMLGSKRLGHAYALTKHPLLLKEVINRDIGLEINVISNVVLSLVRDIRNHPLSVMFALDLPIVLSSDDPGAWEAYPLSDDFYVAFVGAGSKYSDLRMLKTLAFNSLKYSALCPKAKVEAYNKLNAKWTAFINNFNCSSYC